MAARKYKSATEELALTQENPARVGDLKRCPDGGVMTEPKRCGTCGGNVEDNQYDGVDPNTDEVFVSCPDAFHDTRASEPDGECQRCGGIGCAACAARYHYVTRAESDARVEAAVNETDAEWARKTREAQPIIVAEAMREFAKWVEGQLPMGEGSPLFLPLAERWIAAIRAQADTEKEKP